MWWVRGVQDDCREKHPWLHADGAGGHGGGASGKGRAGECTEPLQRTARRGLGRGVLRYYHSNHSGSVVPAR